MNNDFLSDAMNEINDEHIVEAITYKPKVKSISRKAILAAACIIAVTVSALFAYNHLQKPPSKSGGDTTSETEISDNGTTDADTITQIYCPPLYSSWSDVPIYFTTPSFVFEGRTYRSATLGDYAPVFDQSKIKDVIKEDKMLGYTDNHEKITVDVLICEIVGVDKENAVVVGRKDGFQGGYCVYIEEGLYNTDDFSTLLTSLDYKENLILSEHICMYPQNNGEPEIWFKHYKDDPVAYFKENILDIYVGMTDIIKCKDDDQKSINEAFISILENNMEKTEYLQENIELYQYFSEDCLEFEGFVCGYDFTVRFTEEGKLYFFTAEGVTCYNLTEEDFKSFLSLVQSTV